MWRWDCLRGNRSNEHYPHDLPLANPHLTLLDKMGMNVEHFGDSTGKLELLSV